MKIHRFFIQCPLEESHIEIHEKELVNQIVRVLKLKQGEYIELFNKEINVLGKIERIEKTVISIEIEKEIQREEKKREIILALSLLKKDNFEYAVQKAVETGVSGIIPIKTARTIKTAFNKTRLEKIIKEASEQSGRCEIPKLYDEMTREEIKKMFPKHRELCFDASGKSFFQTFSKTNLPNEIIGYIGPEGGWTEEELNSFDAIVSLGSLTLRAETAITVISYLLAKYGE